jgi:hypothetical protein
VIGAARSGAGVGERRPASDPAAGHKGRSSIFVLRMGAVFRGPARWHDRKLHLASRRNVTGGGSETGP